MLRKHDRDPNVSTRIRIAALLWNETIKSLSVCAYVSVKLLNGLVPEQGRDPNVSADLRVVVGVYIPLCAPQAQPRSEFVVTI